MHEGSCMRMAIKSCVGWLFVAPFLSGWPHLMGRSTGNAAPPYRWLQPTGMSTGYCMHVHHDFDGLYLAGMLTDYASPHPFRWGTPHRCLRVIPRLTSGRQKVATHRVQITTPLQKVRKILSLVWLPKRNCFEFSEGQRGLYLKSMSCAR